MRLGLAAQGVFWALIASLLSSGSDALADNVPPTVVMSAAQSNYLQDCGGCHGIVGSATRTQVPDLRDEVGKFLCTASGRQYIVRLPNVAFADVDDQALADLMNFVVFGLGGHSVPANAKAYSAREVGLLRREPLKNSELAQIRRAILMDVGNRCGS